MGLKVFAQKSLAATAVEAFTAELGVVRADTLANLEALDILANGSNDTDSLVAWFRISIPVLW